MALNDLLRSLPEVTFHTVKLRVKSKQQEARKSTGLASLHHLKKSIHTHTCE